MNNFPDNLTYYAFIMNVGIYVLIDLIFDKEKLKFSRAGKD